ncbi:hypothetical protein BGZ83_011674 [Gryganskiella cystojenkinii]|nr:hypothetical protein BGZ83_011674 [Gryganskiella cystojenkinii]
MVYCYYSCGFNYFHLVWIGGLIVLSIIACIIRARRNAARASAHPVNVVMTPVQPTGYPQMQEPGLNYYQPPAPAYTQTSAHVYPPPVGSPYQQPTTAVASPYQSPMTYPPMSDQQQQQLQWQQQQLSLQQQQQQQQPFQYSPSMQPQPLGTYPQLQPAPPSPAMTTATATIASTVSPVPAPALANQSGMSGTVFSPPPVYAAAHPSLQPAPPVEKPQDQQQLLHQAYPMPPSDAHAGGSGNNSTGGFDAPVGTTTAQQVTRPQAPQGFQG